MNKHLLSTLFVFLIWAGAYAVPAKFAPFSVRLTDGSFVTVSVIGDEFGHYLATLDGTPVEEVEDGVYALVPEKRDSLTSRRERRLAAHNAARSTRALSPSRRKAMGVPGVFVGEKKGIVILVDFPDLAFKLEEPRQEFIDLFNEKGYSKNSHKGSVSDYFLTQSYGKFSLDFDIIGPITADKSYKYYGKNNKYGDDAHPAEMVAELCTKAHNDYNVDFTKYDWDGDGYVDQVYVIYAGYGENATGKSEQLWPHEFSFDEAAVYNDGKGAQKIGGAYVNVYAISCELCNSSGSKINGVGMACHEFSHCLGLPDFYDVNYKGGFGMNTWDLLDSGSYNGPEFDGEVPAGFTAYERNFAGWLDYTVLDKPCSIENMPCLADSPTAYIIYNDDNHDEYIILENRQSKGSFEYTKTYTGIHGMLAYHVDYDKTAWETDLVNTSKSHQRMSIIPAGKKYGTYSASTSSYSVGQSTYASQLFPGTGNVTELTDATHGAYNLELFNPNTDGTFNLGKAITNIREKDGLISFDFMGGAQTAISSPDADANAEKEYFTIDGIKLGGAPTQKGVYIVRRGKNVKKLIIR